jgi:hypothetical protein
MTNWNPVKKAEKTVTKEFTNQLQGLQGQFALIEKQLKEAEKLVPAKVDGAEQPFTNYLYGHLMEAKVQVEKLIAGGHV